MARRKVVLAAALALGVGVLLGWMGPVRPGPPTRRDDPDRYCFPWLQKAQYTPTFAVLDTESSLGPHAEHPKQLDVLDLVRMHGRNGSSCATFRPGCASRGRPGHMGAPGAN